MKKFFSVALTVLLISNSTSGLAISKIRDIHHLSNVKIINNSNSYTAIVGADSSYQQPTPAILKPHETGNYKGITADDDIRLALMYKNDGKPNDTPNFLFFIKPAAGSSLKDPVQLRFTAANDKIFNRNIKLDRENFLVDCKNGDCPFTIDIQTDGTVLFKSGENQVAEGHFFRIVPR